MSQKRQPIFEHYYEIDNGQNPIYNTDSYKKSERESNFYLRKQVKVALFLSFVRRASRGRSFEQPNIKPKEEQKNAEYQ